MGGKAPCSTLWKCEIAVFCSRSFAVFPREDPQPGRGGGAIQELLTKPYANPTYPICRNVVFSVHMWHLCCAYMHIIESIHHTRLYIQYAMLQWKVQYHCRALWITRQDIVMSCVWCNIHAMHNLILYSTSLRIHIHMHTVYVHTCKIAFWLIQN